MNLLTNLMELTSNMPNTNQLVEEFKKRHPSHMGEAGGYCLMCACIDAISKTEQECDKKWELKVEQAKKDLITELLSEAPEDIIYHSIHKGGLLGEYADGFNQSNNQWRKLLESKLNK